jgi:hypothetical protein
MQHKLVRDDFATLDIILLTMDFLFETLKTGKTEAEATDDTFLALCCNASWAKLNKYYLHLHLDRAFSRFYNLYCHVPTIQVAIRLRYAVARGLD